MRALGFLAPKAVRASPRRPPAAWVNEAPVRRPKERLCPAEHTQDASMARQQSQALETPAAPASGPRRLPACGAECQVRLDSLPGTATYQYSAPKLKGPWASRAAPAFYSPVRVAPSQEVTSLGLRFPCYSNPAWTTPFWGGVEAQGTDLSRQTLATAGWALWYYCKASRYQNVQLDEGFCQIFPISGISFCHLARIQR